MKLLIIAMFLVMHACAMDAISPCQIDTITPDRKEVTMRAVVFFGMHGGYLLARHCEGQGQHSALLVFPGFKDSPAVNFQLAPGAMDRIAPFFRPTGAPGFACGTFNGTIVVKKNFHLRHIRGKPFGNGYGENGVLRAVFVMRDVVDIHSCDGAANP
jgi:hypothetical protein